MVDALYLRTKSGEGFDEQSIAGFASQLGNAVQDPVDGRRWVIFANPDEARAFEAARSANPSGRLPYVCLIHIRPERISVGQMCEAREMQLARRFVEWLLAQYPCFVEDQDGNDLTGTAEQSLASLYEFGASR